MKKISFILALFALILMVSCGSGKNNDSNKDDVENSCTQGTYKCSKKNNTEISQYCSDGQHWQNETCENGCDEETGKCFNGCKKLYECLQDCEHRSYRRYGASDNSDSEYDGSDNSDSDSDGNGSEKSCFDSCYDNVSQSDRNDYYALSDCKNNWAEAYDDEETNLTVEQYCSEEYRKCGMGSDDSDSGEDDGGNDSSDTIDHTDSGDSVPDDDDSGYIDNTEEIAEVLSQTRIAVKLTYKQGFKTKAEAEVKEGVMVDLDLHLIKRHSLEAEMYGFSREEGLLGTATRSSYIDCPVTMPECEKYWRHDDCWFGDTGYYDYYDDYDSIHWYASLLLDNTWGGGNYKNPEIIGLGTFDNKNNIIDDQYLVVAGYVYCGSQYDDGKDRCDASYNGEDSAYEVDARVEILVDGEEAPRSWTSDKYSASTKDFKIKVNEWKAIAVVKWDDGEAIVTDTAMPDEDIDIDPKNHPVCTYDMSDAYLIPIWDADEYRDYIETPYDEGWIIGTCE